jgi:hypothetical protein
MITEPTDKPAATMHEQCINDIATETGGRWRGNREVTVTGSRPAWVPPTISGAGPWATPDPLPLEPPTGECIDAVPSMETVSGIDLADAIAIDSAANACLNHPGHDCHCQPDTEEGSAP